MSRVQILPSAARACTSRPLGRLQVLLAGLGLVLLPTLVPSPAGAADPGPVLTLSAPSTATKTGPTTLTATLTDAAGQPVASTPVTFQRQDPGWTTLGQATTDADGVATYPATTPVDRDQASYQAVGGGVTSNQVLVTGTKVGTTMTMSAPAWWVTDERSRDITVSWRTNTDQPVHDAVVVLERRPVGGSWVGVTRGRTGPRGLVGFRVTPREDDDYRVRGGDGPYWTGAAAGPRRMDNRPPVPPVAYPAAAPKPRYVAPQPRGFGQGAHAVVTRIPNAVWNNMTGISWRRGCPVGRSQLRLIRINYWDFTGYRRRGEMVVNAAIAGKAVGALREMYDRHFPLRRMYRVDHFGYSSRSHGGNDYAAMASDNSSAFNCRWVSGTRGRTSPHSTGRSIDLNTWENPYASASGILPDRWWYGRSHPRIAWPTSSHPVVQIWRRHGFRWTYAVQDAQHYDGRRVTSLEGGFAG